MQIKLNYFPLQGGNDDAHRDGQSPDQAADELQGEAETGEGEGEGAEKAGTGGKGGRSGEDGRRDQQEAMRHYVVGEAEEGRDWSHLLNFNICWANFCNYS